MKWKTIFFHRHQQHITVKFTAALRKAILKYTQPAKVIRIFKISFLRKHNGTHHKLLVTPELNLSSVYLWATLLYATNPLSNFYPKAVESAWGIKVKLEVQTLIKVPAQHAANLQLLPFYLFFLSSLPILLSKLSRFCVGFTACFVFVSSI